MSSATSAYENHQGNGRLKLKIKYSRSKGFVSDFVSEAARDASSHVHKQFHTTFSKPVPSCDSVSSSQHSSASGAELSDSKNQSHLSLPASGSKQLSPSQNTCTASGTVSKSSYSSQPTVLHQLLSSDSATRHVGHHLGAVVFSSNTSNDTVCDVNNSKVAPLSVHSSLDVEQFCSLEAKGLHQALCNKVTEKPHKKNAELVGVNYGEMLQDLEFLSVPQDEPGGQDASNIFRTKERHMSGICQAQKHKLTVVECGSVAGGKTGIADTQMREETSDGEPMSPFDIDCSLGLSDDFTFSLPTQSPIVKQNGKKEVKENALFPWRVVDTTTDADCEELLLSKIQKHPNGGKSMYGSSMNTTQYSPSEQYVKISAEQSLHHSRYKQGADSTVKTVIVDCPNHAGSRPDDSEINNNGHVSQHSGHNCVHRNRSESPAGTVHVPQSAALRTSGVAHNRVTLAFPSVSDNTCTGGSDAETQKIQSHTQRHSSDSLIDLHVMQPSVMDRYFSSSASHMQHHSSVSCKRPSIDTATDVRRNNEVLVTSASHLSVPQHVHGKECDSAQVRSKLVMKLLTSEDKVPNAMHSAWPSTEQTSRSTVFDNDMEQLAENPPLIERVPAPLTSQTAEIQAVENTVPPSGPVTSAACVQLNQTIDELKKRVACKVTPNLSESSAQSRSSQDFTSEICNSSSGSAKRKRPQASQWCRCKAPELEVFSEGHENAEDDKASKEKFCRKCRKRVGRKGKKKSVPVWCHCDSPDPYIPSGTVSEMCRKCLMRVSKKWRKRTAAQWCKCLTPVLCTVGQANDQDENVSDKVYFCRRCCKWIRKDREDVCMKGFRFGPLCGENIFSEVGPQLLMTDHNYSQSPFSPSALSKHLLPSSVSVTNHTTQREQSADLPGSDIHRALSKIDHQGTCTSQNILVVYPCSSGTKTSKNSVQSHNSHSGHFASGSGISGVDSQSSQNESASSVMPCSAAATSSSPGCVLSSSGSLYNNCSKSGLTVSTPDDFSTQETVVAACTSETDKAQCEETSVVETRRQLCKRIPCPVWLQGISLDLLQPCYVVMEKLDGESSFEHAAVKPIGPLSLSCRQKSLNVLCKRGELQQCGHSLEGKHLVDKCTDNAHHMSLCSRKRAYFRHNKTLVGYEAAVQTEMLKYQKAVSSVQGEKVKENVSSPGYFPLSSACPQGFVNFRITSHDGVRVQQYSENSTNPVPIFHQNGDQNIDQLQDASGIEGAEDTSVAQLMPEANSSLGNEQNLNGTKEDLPNYLKKKLSRDHGTTWRKTSQFHFRYYVFGSENRAFIIPLRQNPRSKTVLQLDEEDLRYIWEAINQMLAEKDSCARHLKYPDSLQHKEPSRTDGHCANKKQFVAPTLGCEDLDIEGLKSLISERDFSRLVPRNTRISKSKYLQEIGEKVHMYLTGGSEETPEWIKDVAKSIVMKHRKRVKTKPRLKPSKDVSIEIDYAEEGELLEVDEGILSPSHDSVTESAPATASCMTMSEKETAAANQSYNHEQSKFSEADHMNDSVGSASGSYVVAEAFAQEEKKPLIQNLFETVQENNVSAVDGSIPEAGQQILIPLPESCNYGQEPEGRLSPSIPLPAYGVQQQQVNELSVNEEQQDKKPLLGELLAATILPLPVSVKSTKDDSGLCESQQAYEQHTVMTAQSAQPPEELLPSWRLAHVKEEPLDEGYSHAWPDEGQTIGAEVPCSAHQIKGHDMIPFISNSTFGKGSVQIDDEELPAASCPDHNTCMDSGTEVHTVIKMEPYDAGSGEQTGGPVVTCVASGELGAVLTNPDHSEASRVADSTQIHCLAHGEAFAYGAEVSSQGVLSSTEISPCTSDQSVTSLNKASLDEMKPIIDSGAHGKKVTFAELLGAVKNNFGETAENKGLEEVSACEQTQIIIMHESADLPQISALTFGEAAKLWETGDDRHSADSTETVAPSDSSIIASPGQSEVLPVINSVMYGNEVDHEDGESAHDFHHESENSSGQNAVFPEDQNEEDFEDTYGEDDYYEEEENTESELKPILTSEGQILAIPLVLPAENNFCDVRQEQTLNVSQVGVDLSIVKQEPQEDGDPNVSLVNSSPFLMSTQVAAQCSVLPNHQDENVNPLVDESPPLPSILEVRSLAALGLPSAKERTEVDTQEVSQEVQNSSSVMVSSLQVESSKNLKHPADPYLAQNEPSPSEVAPDVNCDVSKVSETGTDEIAQHHEKQNRSYLKSVLLKTISKKRNRKSSGKRRQQQKMPPTLVAELSDFKQQPKETDKLSVLQGDAPGAEGGNMFPPQASPPSSPKNKISSSSWRTDFVELELVSANTVSASQITSSLTSGVVTPSDSKSANQNITDGYGDESGRDVASTRDASSVEKCSSPNSNLTPAAVVIQPSKQDTLTSCKDQIQSSSYDLAKDGHSTRITPVRAEVIQPNEESQPYIEDSQHVDKDASNESDLTQVIHNSVSKNTSISASNGETAHIYNINSVPAGKGVALDNALQRPDSCKVLLTGSATPQKSTSTGSAVLQKDSAWSCVGERGTSNPVSLSEYDTIHTVQMHCSDVHKKEKSHSQTMNLADHLNRDHEKRTCDITHPTAVLESQVSHTLPEQSDCMEANSVVEQTAGGANSCGARTLKARRAFSNSKRKQKNRTVPVRTAASSLASVSGITDSSLRSIDSNAQDAVLTANGAELSCVPVSQPVSDERDSSVLTLRITRSSKSSTKCLSENQVSSSCEVPEIFEKPDSVNSDPDRMKRLSLNSPDSVRNNTTKKPIAVGKKDVSKHDSEASHKLAQPSQDSVKPQEDSATTTASKCDILDENAHYVSQISEGKGKQGRTCLVLRKKRPAPSSSLPLASNVHRDECHVIGHVQEQLKEKDSAVPHKKSKQSIIFQVEGQVNAVAKGLKRKLDVDNSDRKSDKSRKVSWSERSIFSDMSAVLSSLSAPLSESPVSTALTKPQAGSGVEKAVSEAVVKVAEKGFNENLFSRLRASLVSVTDKVVAVKNEEPENKSSSTVSSSSSQNARERSFFDCLPQGFVDAWKNK